MLPEQLLWGAVPSGFSRRSDGRGFRMVVRQGLESTLDFSIFNGANPRISESRYEGRGVLRTINLPGGDAALIRGYRHGGFFRALTGGWFCAWPPRPFRELTITEELRRRGLPTVEVCGACIERGVGPFYRGWLITRELRDAADLWSALRSGLAQRLGLEPTLRAVAASVSVLHRQGVYHQDLNLKNILIRAEAGEVVSYIIDFDRAKLFLGPLPELLVQRNFARLLRSLHKLDPEGNYFPHSDWQQFVKFYHDAPKA